MNICEICCLYILTINQCMSFWETAESAQTKLCSDMPLMIVFQTWVTQSQPPSKLHPLYNIIQASVIIMHLYVDRTGHTETKKLELWISFEMEWAAMFSITYITLLHILLYYIYYSITYITLLRILLYYIYYSITYITLLRMLLYYIY